MQENHYDPWGWNLVGIETEGDPEHKWQFIDREKLEELSLNWYDLKARGYESVLGRFHSVDPKPDIERQESLSTYQYGWDNPIFRKDPNGDCPTCPQGKEAKNIYAAGATVFNKDGAWQWTGDKWADIQGSASQLRQRESREENRITGSVTGSFYAKGEAGITGGLRFAQEGDIGGGDLNTGSKTLLKLGMEVDSRNSEHDYGFQPISEGVFAEKKTSNVGFGLKGSLIGLAYKFEGTEIRGKMIGAKSETTITWGPLFIKYESDAFSDYNILSAGFSQSIDKAVGGGITYGYEVGTRVYLKK